ncbi:MAG TPA: hypothetical protein VJA47_03130 [archaeon]|nr:hypothetical protein [archaeon]
MSTRLPVRQRLSRQYALDAELLAEIEQKENVRAGYVLVHYEEGPATELRIADVAGQVACGNRASLLLGDVEVVSKKTGKPVDLTLYFVERYSYIAACDQRRAERRERLSASQ